MNTPVLPRFALGLTLAALMGAAPARAQTGLSFGLEPVAQGQWVLRQSFGEHFVFGSYGLGLMSPGPVSYSLLRPEFRWAGPQWKLGIGRQSLWFSGRWQDSLSLSLGSSISELRPYDLALRYSLGEREHGMVSLQWLQQFNVGGVPGLRSQGIGLNAGYSF